MEQKAAVADSITIIRYMHFAGELPSATEIILEAFRVEKIVELDKLVLQDNNNISLPCLVETGKLSGIKESDLVTVTGKYYCGTVSDFLNIYEIKKM